MYSRTLINNGSTLILRGIHLSPTEAMKVASETKAERLFCHEPGVLRLRTDGERDLRGRSRVFIAKDRIELTGPDMTAYETTEDAYAALNLLVDRLDGRCADRIEITGPDTTAYEATEDAYDALNLLVDRLDRRCADRIEITDPDMTAFETTEDAYAALHLLIDRLDPRCAGKPSTVSGDAFQTRSVPTVR